MYRKLREKLVVVMFLLFAVCMVCSVDSQAAKKKSKVTWKIKKGTLTVYGKGKMPLILIKKKEMRKVKKVVIKKGITTISRSAFEDMKNLKTAKIPSTVKSIGDKSFAGTAIKKLKVPSSVKKIGGHAFTSSRLRKLILPGDFKYKTEYPDWGRVVVGEILGNNNPPIVQFSTKLNLENASLFVAKGYVVSKKDSKYCSVDGCIYTKDRKSLIRVPLRKKKLVIAEGCTEFCLQSVFHGLADGSDLAESCNVSEIEIPASVKTIESKKYRQKYRNSGPAPDIKKITIRTKQLDGRSLAVLAYDLEVDAKKLMEQLPEQIYYRDGKYYSKDGVWIKPYPNKGYYK